eukprot:10713022-Heterocapsa_arctica.AAC.1
MGTWPAGVSPKVKPVAASRGRSMPSGRPLLASAAPPFDRGRGHVDLRPLRSAAARTARKALRASHPASIRRRCISISSSQLVPSRSRTSCNVPS